MKFVAIFSVFVFVGCGSTRIAKTNIEHCSLQGRDLYPNQVITGTHSTTVGTVVNGRYVTASGSSNSDSVSCGRPANKYERCLSRKLNQSGLAVAEYNDGEKLRRTLTGIAYVPYILPGVGAMIYNNSVNKEELAKVNKIREEAFKYCEKYQPQEEII